MAVLKCKMCGGTIEFTEGETVGICDSCGTKQTLPKSSDDAVSNMFARANALRLKCDFDKAEDMYNKILSENSTEAEAYWGLILCKYGIEYVDDPGTGKKVPTCHRASYDAVSADPDYKSAISYADMSSRSLYEEEAAAIDEIQKGILDIVKNEKPFDVFICYKETDENGKRTQDSVIANDIYHQLTQEGFKVFYAAITLEDKLGREYEPYIFSALNTAKVMLVVGSKQEYFEAVWVKNEWSRYLKLMKTDKSKLLIPCYKDMDAYELPEDFAHLQAQDMTKIGFINDIVRGIKKVIETKEPAQAAKETVTSAPSNANIQPLLERVYLFLEDGKWQDANIYCEKVLDIDPKNAEAYLGKLMAELQVRNRKQLADCAEPFDDRDNYSKVLRFGNGALETEMRGYITHINDRNENTRLTGIYDNAQSSMRNAQSEDAYKKAAEVFKSISGFKDVDALAEQCLEKAEKAAKKAKKITAITIPSVAAIVALIIVLTYVIIPNNKYNAAKALYDNGQYEEAITAFEAMNGYKDSEFQIENCYIGKFGEKVWNEFKNLKAGDTYKFGSYEQDNNSSNGKEDIEWIVLEKKDLSVMLISKYALDCQQYNTTYTDITWEKCSLRKWLNGTFLNNAFSSEEQAKIAATNVTADKNPKYSTNPGNATSDKIFLLSIAEAEKYFTTDESRKCAPTAYAKAQGVAYTSDSYWWYWWWLRLPGDYQYTAASVRNDGSVSYDGKGVDVTDACVRPALWININ